MDRYADLRPLDYFIKDLSALWWWYLLLGLLLAAWGIAIVIWPQLLVAFVAALFIMAGVTVLGLAWRIWQLQRRYQSFKREMIGRRTYILRQKGLAKRPPALRKRSLERKHWWEGPTPPRRMANAGPTTLDTGRSAPVSWATSE